MSSRHTISSQRAIGSQHEASGSQWAPDPGVSHALTLNGVSPRLPPSQQSVFVHIVVLLYEAAQGFAGSGNIPLKQP